MMLQKYICTKKKKRKKEETKKKLVKIEGVKVKKRDKEVKVGGKMGIVREKEFPRKLQGEEKKNKMKEKLFSQK